MEHMDAQLTDMIDDIDLELTHCQTQEGLVVLRAVFNHLFIARAQLRRVVTVERDAAQVRFDIEQDITEVA